ncbi:hypothetical protein AAVH_41172, partial [Aphelenchoides avenae]
DSTRRPSSIEKIHVRVEWLDSVGADADYEASLHGGDFAETVRRLRHTCITNFSVGFRDSPFFRYWKAQGAAAFTVKNIFFGEPDTTDYSILDSIVNHLRPSATVVLVNESSWRKDGWNSKKLELLARDSLLKHLHTCWLGVHHGGAFPPSSFILKEPGYAHYELLCVGMNIAERIDGFIESFIRDGCTNKKLESVSIKWSERSHASKQLSKPTKVNVPLPKLYVMAWMAPNPHRVSQCEMHAFVSTKQRQRMKVFKWTIEYEKEGCRRTTQLLQCRVEDL